MSRNVDIADLGQADGLDPRACDKINSNFRRLVQSAGDIPLSQTLVNDIASAVEPVVQRKLMDSAYPVGSVIATMDENDMRLSFGTWRRVGQGRLLMSASAKYPSGSTGGSESVTLKASDIPAHSHSYEAASDSSGSAYPAQSSEKTRAAMSKQTSTWPAAAQQTSVSIVPQYFAAYMYERTA